jgi:hypothetical protein
MRAFLAGLMLLAGLILLAACANLGSLFAARAADRGREVALRLALGSSRSRIMRQLFTEAVLISLVGGAAGLWGSVVLLHWLSLWQPFPQFAMTIPVSPDANVYLVALLLALASGFLFGAVPVRQVLRTNPYEVVKSGSSARAGRRLTVRDLLLVVQIAICAVLVTSSFVALRGLARSLHTNFGFEPRNAMLVDTNLTAGGLQRRPGTYLAKAHDRSHGGDSWRNASGIGGCSAITYGLEPPAYLYRQRDRSKAMEGRRSSRHLQDISQIFPGGGYCHVGGQNLLPG